MEAERAWREEEMRFLQNQCKDLSDGDREVLTCVILMAYAHVEGFTKFALLSYIRCVNSSGLRCDEVVDSIAAASLNDVFLALSNPEKKSDLFRDVPDDTALHRFARQREFVEHSAAILS